MLNWFKKTGSGQREPEDPLSQSQTQKVTEPDIATEDTTRTLAASAIPDDDTQEVMDRIGPYRIIRPLSEGGMGRVFLVSYDPPDGPPGPKQKYALKTLMSMEKADDETRERFRREILIGLNLHHPNVIRMVDWGVQEPEDTPYIVMEMLEGETLVQHVERCGALPLEDAKRIIIQMLLGLQAIHEAGVIHRDLKPHNVFITAEGDAKIMDFGIARKAGFKNITATGTALGTPAFISPEQLTDTKRVDHRTDLFNVGLVFYYILTGRLPFEGPTVSAVVKRVLQESVTPISAMRPDLPPSVELWMSRLLVRDKEQRFPTARAAMEAIRF